MTLSIRCTKHKANFETVTLVICCANLGKWSEAFEVAEKHDRIHLRNTHYNYAKYLESVGAIEAAIEKWVDE